MNPQADDAQSPVSDLYDTESFRSQGHQLIDLIADYLDRAMDGRSMPVLEWTEPEEMMKRWALPACDQPRTKLLDMLSQVIREANHLHDPRNTGHQVAPPLLDAALCDFVASVLNNGMAVYDHGMAATAMELHVVKWMTQVLGLGDQAEGLLTSGGSVGNLTALLAAREAAVRRGLMSQSSQWAHPPAVLGTQQAHYSIGRAIKVMGWGQEGLIPVPHDHQLRLRPDALEETFRLAEQKGRRVIAVIANACCTPTGTYDPLNDMADFCERHGLWFHVDGAHGAAACLSAKYRHRVAGIQRADSVVWDAHKLLLVPALCTAVLFRSASDAYTAYAHEASYLFERAPEEERYNLGHRTIECTKRMLALKVYAALACKGAKALGDYVTDRFDLARRFAAVIQEAPDFELGHQPESNIVCFRYLAGNTHLDEIQARTRRRLLERGNCYVVQVHLPRGLFLRAALMNPLTQEHHLTQLLDEIREINLTT